MNSEIPIRILEVLREFYNEDPTGIISTPELADMLKISTKDAQGALIYLKEKELINSYQKTDGWYQKISAYGIDELQIIKTKNNTQKIETTKQSYDELLEIEVDRNKFQGLMNIFISHKFVKADQELATHLENLLKENNLYGYIAERKKEYEKPLSEKIKSRINDSHYLVAILTKHSVNSPSVHQEIGYAIGTKTPVLIMAEKGEVPGVLVQGYEHEEFSRQNFSKACKNIVNYILDHGPPPKISDDDKQWLKNNAYGQLYNKMMAIYENPDKFKMITSNPWKELEPSIKLKVEDEVKQLFEEFTKKLTSWQITLSRLNQNFTINQATLGEIIKTPFELVSLLKPDGYIILDRQTSQEPKQWIEAFKFIIFDESITNEQILYEKLLNFAVETNNGHQRWLQDWKTKKSQLYGYIFKILPSLRDALRIDYHNEELQKQKEDMITLVEKIVNVLEERIR